MLKLLVLKTLFGLNMATGHWLNVHCLVNVWIGKCSTVCTLFRQKCKCGLMDTVALCFSESCFAVLRISSHFDSLTAYPASLYFCKHAGACLGFFRASVLNFLFFFFCGATSLRKFINSHWTESTALLCFRWNLQVMRRACCVFSSAALACLPCSAQTPSAAFPGCVGRHQSWGKKTSYKNTKKAFVNNLIGFGSSDVCTCPLGGDKILWQERLGKLQTVPLMALWWLTGCVWIF